MKVIYDKFTANIILSGEKLKIRNMKSGTFSPFLFNIIPEILARTISQDK